MIFLTFAATHSVQAQEVFASHPQVQLRIGAMYSTPLVKDAVSSINVDQNIPGKRSEEVTIRQQIAPIATIALRLPMRGNSQVELSASGARSAIRGDDGYAKWDVANATVASFLVGFGYLYHSAVALRGGVGATRIFAEQSGLFTKGNTLKPVIEAGASTAVRIGSRPIAVDLRLQSHGFGTTTLRDNGGSDGNVFRAIAQIGTTLWGGR